MKRTYITTLIIFLGCSILVLTLFLLSADITHKHNSFLRLFPPHPVVPENTLDIKYNSYYIAGASDSKFYFGNFTAPLHVLETNTLLADTQHYAIQIHESKGLRFSRPTLTVDSPNFYLTDGVGPFILKGIIQQWTASRFMYDSAYFTEAVPISHGSFAIRAVSRTNENILGKETRYAPYVTLVPGVLTKQVDGLFCTDGMLHYTKKLNYLVYLYHYRNQFICMDTNLNIRFTGKTIDTVSRARITVAKIKSENSVTLSSPPLTVNKRSCVSGNYLFVNSNLMARNENKELFDESDVIDVYSLIDGIYQFSFYLYRYKDDNLREFKVFGDKLVALYGNSVQTYRLMPKYFP